MHNKANALTRPQIVDCAPQCKRRGHDSRLEHEGLSDVCIENHYPFRQVPRGAFTKELEVLEGMTKSMPSAMVRQSHITQNLEGFHMNVNVLLDLHETKKSLVARKLVEAAGVLHCGSLAGAIFFSAVASSG